MESSSRNGNFIYLENPPTKDNPINEEDDGVEIYEAEEWIRRTKSNAKGKKRAFEPESDESTTSLIKAEPSDPFKPFQLPTPLPTPTGCSHSSFPSASTSSAFSLDDRHPLYLSTSSNAAFSSLPAAPASPSRSKPSPSHRTTSTSLPIPLDRLIPVGTLVVPSRLLNQTQHSVEAEDGWILFNKDLLANDDDLVILDPQPSPSGGRKRRKTGQTTKKRIRDEDEKYIDTLLLCCQSLVFRGTVKIVDSQAIVRIYLVPQDLPELKELKYSRHQTKRPPVSTLWPIFSAIRCSDTEWNGSVVPSEVPKLLDETEAPSLLEIFHGIEVPGSDGFDVLDCSREIKERLWTAFGEQPAQAVTELYEYQRASVAKMLAREIAPALIVPPNFLPRISSINASKTFYVSLDGAVAVSPPRIREPKSGILAEDMGVGKTLMILSLILTTRGELPSLEGVSTHLDGSFPCPPPTLLTEESVDFPFETHVRARCSLRPRVPVAPPGYAMFAKEEEEYLAKLAKQAEEDAAELQRPQELPSLRSLMLSSVKTSFGPTSLNDEETNLGDGLFKSLTSTAPFYWLTPTSAQLDSREGRKGLLKPIKIVVTATTLLVVPTDLVRQWKEELDKHFESGSIRSLTFRTKIEGPLPPPNEIALYDVVILSAARFAAAAEAGDQTLRGIHWKRIVVDEGHVLSSGNLTRSLAEELRCECRWAVSGTPTTNLRGAEVDGKLAGASIKEGGDRSDVDRLGQLFARFLKHPAFPHPTSLRHLVTTHQPKQREQLSRLVSTFDRCIVRHRTDLVKPSINLPPLEVKITYVEMEESERKMYNALTALFASNSIQSQRIDVDYLFSKNKSQELNELCDNLEAASTFFASKEIDHRLYEGAQWALERLESNKAASWSEEDKVSLRKAIKVMKEACADREWRLTTNETKVAAEVVGLEDELVTAFGGLKASNNPLGRSLISLEQLIRLRQDLTELRHVDVKAWSDDEELVEELITFEARRKRWDWENVGRKGKKDDKEVESVFKKRNPKLLHDMAPLPVDSTLLNVQIVRTTSAKINHVLQELRQYPDDKFIIFSSSLVDLLFANLSEALDLFGIRHLIFAGSHARSGLDRGAKAQLFNTTSAREYQVILVDVEKGGRGIGLTGASRVIMLEPVWKPDLELQATKRAHRLGQTKPVSLEILVVKDTYEHALLERRAKIDAADFAKKVKVPQQDESLRNLLQSAKYLEPTDKAKLGQPVSDALVDPPVMLIVDGGHDVTRN